ncbi:MAG: anaerobic ribonucleoside-triphosphate reductase activating protein [Christensenellales bacterium]
MNFGAIKNNDIANGLGIRISLFVSGCTHHCKGCFNAETWNFDYGKPFTKDEENQIISLLKKPHIKGLTLLGGEPMEPQNQAEVVKLLRRVKSELPQKDVWCYSGYTLEELQDKNHRTHTPVTDEILGMLDVLVDGEFVAEKKNLKLKFRGSENQRIIDMKQTQKDNKIVLLEL